MTLFNTTTLASAKKKQPTLISSCIHILFKSVINFYSFHVLLPCKTGFDLLWIVADLLSDLLYTWCCFDVSYTCYNNHHLLHNHRCCSVEKFCVYSIRHRQVIFFMFFFCRFLNVSRLACKPRAVQLISSSGSRIDSSEKRTRIQNSPFYSSFRNMTSRILWTYSRFSFKLLKLS